MRRMAGSGSGGRPILHIPTVQSAHFSPVRIKHSFPHGSSCMQPRRALPMHQSRRHHPCCDLCRAQLGLPAVPDSWSCVRRNSKGPNSASKGQSALLYSCTSHSIARTRLGITLKHYSIYFGGPGSAVHSPRRLPPAWKTIYASFVTLSNLADPRVSP